MAGRRDWERATAITANPAEVLRYVHIDHSAAVLAGAGVGFDACAIPAVAGKMSRLFALALNDGGAIGAVPTTGELLYRIRITQTAAPWGLVDIQEARFYWDHTNAVIYRGDWLWQDPGPPLSPGGPDVIMPYNALLQLQNLRWSSGWQVEVQLTNFTDTNWAGPELWAVVGDTEVL